jgi:hypothetical protein
MSLKTIARLILDAELVFTKILYKLLLIIIFYGVRYHNIDRDF